MRYAQDLLSTTTKSQTNNSRSGQGSSDSLKIQTTQLSAFMTFKRTRAEMESQATGTASSPFMPMFEGFRAELDEHHDRRERIIKASRDVTAASKKMFVEDQAIENALADGM
jgi:hypothetical protein